MSSAARPLCNYLHEHQEDEDRLELMLKASYDMGSISQSKALTSEL